MKTFVLPHVSKRFLSFLLAVFVLAAFFGAGYAGMAIDSRGQMERCPLMGVTAPCQMSSLEHIAAWQYIFTVSSRESIAVFLILVGFILLGAFVLRNRFHTRRVFSAPFSACSRRTEARFIPRALQEIFSRGILNPKIF